MYDSSRPGGNSTGESKTDSPALIQSAAVRTAVGSNAGSGSLRRRTAPRHGTAINTTELLRRARREGRFGLTVDDQGVCLARHDFADRARRGGAGGTGLRNEPVGAIRGDANQQPARRLGVKKTLYP